MFFVKWDEIIMLYTINFSCLKICFCICLYKTIIVWFDLRDNDWHTQNLLDKRLSLDISLDTRTQRTCWSGTLFLYGFLKNQTVHDSELRVQRGLSRLLMNSSILLSLELWQFISMNFFENFSYFLRGH